MLEQREEFGILLLNEGLGDEGRVLVLGWHTGERCELSQLAEAFASDYERFNRYVTVDRESALMASARMPSRWHQMRGSARGPSPAAHDLRSNQNEECMLRGWVTRMRARARAL